MPLELSKAQTETLRSVESNLAIRMQLSNGCIGDLVESCITKVAYKL